MKIQTFSIFKDLLENCFDKIKSISSNTSVAYNKQMDDIIMNLKNDLNSLNESYPALIQMQINDSTISNSTLLETITNRAKGTYALKMVHQSYDLWHLQGLGIYVPTVTPLDKPLVLSHSKKESSMAIESLNRTLFNILIQLPPNAINLYIIDTELTGATGPITSKLRPETYHKSLITGLGEIQRIISEVKQSIVDRMAKYNKVLEYYESNKKIINPYTIIVFVSYPQEITKTKEDLDVILQKGANAGIYSIFLDNKDNSIIKNLMSASQYHELSIYVNSFSTEDKENLISYPSPIFDNKELMSKCLNYINSGYIEQEKIINEQGYIDITEEISIPIGMTYDNNKINFIFNSSTGHNHTFIIGKSGSGKSVLMRSIICQIINNYKPEDIQLYLFDLKLGGVEFNAYRNTPHVESLLVDSEDPQITLTILQDLYKKMQDRGTTLRNAGVAKIEEYNAIHKNDRLPHIIVAIDECHTLFSTSNSPKIQNQINSIVNKIATEGRNQGVHLILATQTLANASIPIEIINNISDYYIFKCSSSDSNRLVSGSERVSQNLKVGEAVYCFEEIEQTFKTMFIPINERKEKIKEASLKAQNSKCNRKYYFNGKIEVDLSNTILEKYKNEGCGLIGCGISLDSPIISINLKNNISENVLLFGANDEGQCSRISVNLLATMALICKQNNINCSFYVIDCINDDTMEYFNVLHKLEDIGLCKIIHRKELDSWLYNIASEIKKHNGDSKKVLLIHGQERFKELKNNIEIHNEKKSSKVADNPADPFASLSFSVQDNNLKTYHDCISYILDNGPECGIHTILQVDKPSKILFEDYQSQRTVLAKFKHLIMLHTDDRNAYNLVNDDIDLNKLCYNNDRLRAIYFNDDTSKYTTISPYKLIDINNIKI